MKRDDYLKDKNVKGFTEWATKLMTGERMLEHSLEDGKPCASLYKAYEKYDWPSEVKLADGSLICTRTFDETAELFNVFRELLQEAARADIPTDKDKDIFLTTAIYIIRWGKIPKLEKSLLRMGRNALPTLKPWARCLDPKRADTEALKGFKYMGAGYSKIYSTMIDDFPIYDSRVACTLTSLIWLFCRENHLAGVPELLKLGIPVDRSSQNRNPYGFPKIQGAQYSRYADSNLKAAWILGELVKRPGPFMDLPENRRVRALEAALFMVGYKPLGKDAIRKESYLGTPVIR